MSDWKVVAYNKYHQAIINLHPAETWVKSKATSGVCGTSMEPISKIRY